MNQNLKKALRCLNCGGELEDLQSSLRCLGCHREYNKQGNSFFFSNTGEFISGNKTDSLIFGVKNLFKKIPGLFRLFYRLIYPHAGITPKKFIRSLPPEALIINLGSGVMTIDPRVIDVDYTPYPNVSIVADACNLPFKDGSIDAIISESLLEHMPDPEKIVAEMRRILKPGGLFYTLTPFMLGFHSSPNDYRRWTKEGLKELFKDFEIKESGAAFGPTSALTTVAIEWISMVLSFGNKNLYQFLYLCLLPFLIIFNWLDIFISRYKFSSNNAMALYFIGRKRK